MSDYKSKFGYMCRTNFLYELGEAQGGVTAYASVKETLEHCHCAKSCGIAKVEMFYIQDALEGDGSGNMLMGDIENKTAKYIQSEKQFIEHYRKQAEFNQNRSNALLALADKLEQKLEKIEKEKEENVEEENVEEENVEEENVKNFGTLARLFSTNNNLRTDFIYGRFEKLPEVDSSFTLISKPLENVKDVDARLILTTPVKRVWETSLNGFPVVLFTTRNSLYALYVNKELTEWPTKKRPTPPRS